MVVVGCITQFEHLISNLFALEKIPHETRFTLQKVEEKGKYPVTYQTDEADLGFCIYIGK